MPLAAGARDEPSRQWPVCGFAKSYRAFAWVSDADHTLRQAWEAVEAILKENHKSLSSLKVLGIHGKWSQEDFEGPAQYCRARGIVFYVQEPQSDLRQCKYLLAVRSRWR